MKQVMKFEDALKKLREGEDKAQHYRFKDTNIHGISKEAWKRTVAGLTARESTNKYFYITTDGEWIVPTCCIEEIK